jgi:MSHA biogenesis protein MshK
MKKRLSQIAIAMLLLPAISVAAQTIAPQRLNDPTQPPGTLFNPQDNSSVSGALVLNAVFIYPTYRIAIISGQAVKIGDRINELTVSSIEQNTVELTGSKNEVTVLSLGAPIKQKSPS